jgi:hypothetical protein
MTGQDFGSQLAAFLDRRAAGQPERRVRPGAAVRGKPRRAKEKTPKTPQARRTLDPAWTFAVNAIADRIWARMMEADGRKAKEESNEG